MPNLTELFLRCADLYLKQIEFRNYRNLENSCFEPVKGINVIYGSNAQGKTNLIECIWLFTGGRSFRGSTEKEIIAFGKDKAFISASFNTEGRDQKLEISIEKGKRKASLNGIPRKYLSEIVGKFCAVVFSPDHLTLIKNGPDERRGFIDAAICQTDPMYAARLSRYKKTLNERNNLLKSILRNPSLRDTLSVWDEALADSGSKVAIERAKYIEKLCFPAVAFYDGISRGKEKMTLEYRMNCKAENRYDIGEIYDKTLLALKNRHEEDILCGYTNSGVHRDDIVIKINGRDAKSFGSQGQQRSAVLSMKLAEAAVLGKEKGESPVILLDDVLSELDPSRQNFLLTKLSGMQVFITCCEKNTYAENVICVSEGRITAEE